MKSTKYIFFIIVGSLVLTACKDMEGFNLKRDNQLDGKNNAGNKNAELKFDSYRIRLASIDCSNCPTEIFVCLRNAGTGDAKGVKATFHTESSYISNFAPKSQVNYGDIKAGKVRWADYFNGENYEYEPYRSGYTIQFIVSSTMPTGTQIPININIIDNSGNSWTDSFEVPTSQLRQK